MDAVQILHGPHDEALTEMLTVATLESVVPLFAL